MVIIWYIIWPLEMTNKVHLPILLFSLKKAVWKNLHIWVQPFLLFNLLFIYLFILLFHYFKILGSHYKVISYLFLFFLALHNGTIYAWKPNKETNGFELATTLIGHNHAVVSLTIDGRRLYSGSMDIQ